MSTRRRHVASAPLDVAIYAHLASRLLTAERYPGSLGWKMEERLSQISTAADHSDLAYMQDLVRIATRSGRPTVSILFVVRHHPDAVYQ